MNILISAWEKCDLEKVREAWESLDQSAVLYSEKPRERKQDPRFRSVLRKFIKETQIDAIFSISYYPILSRVCQETDIAYICWCPTFLTDDITESLLQYNKNYYFLFDRQAVSNLQQTGVANVFYLPYAIDFPEQIEAYKDSIQIDNAMVSSYTDGYMKGLLQINQYMKQYEEGLSADKLLDFQNNYLGMHSLEKRLQSIIQRVMCK